MALKIKDLIFSTSGKMIPKLCPVERMLTGGILLLFLHANHANEVMDDDSGDPVLEIDEEDTVGQTKLPNSHSAALVMSFIVLCVVGYFIYRLIKAKCCPQNNFPREESKKSSDAESTEAGLKKQHEDYLAIYGPKKINTVSGAISKNERTGLTVPGSLPN